MSLRQIPPYVWTLAGSTTLLVGFLYYTFLDEVPLTKRKRWMISTPSFEHHLGKIENQRLKKQYEKDILHEHHRAVSTTRRVGNRIRSAGRKFQPDYRVLLLDSVTGKRSSTTVIRNEAVANAFVLPGNNIFLFTGLFRHVHDEDELAAVLAHETAHHLARHAGERMSGLALRIILWRLCDFFDSTGILSWLFLPASTIMRELPNSRAQEMEADTIGMQLAAEACFDPRAAIRVFQSMERAAQQQSSSTAEPPEFLSTHPSHGNRIRHLQEQVPKVLPLYLRSECQTIRKEMEQARKLDAQRHARRESWEREIAARNTRQ